MDFPVFLAAGVSGSLSYYSTPSGPNIAEGSPASNTYTASAAVFMQVFTPVPLTVAGFGWLNGSAVSGNIDCGLYDKNGKQLGHTGSTLQSGTNAPQIAAASGGAFSIAAGNYYVAFAIDNTTGAVFAQSAAPAFMNQMLGIFGMSAAFPLPSTATFAAPSQQRIPVCAAFIEGSTY